MSLRSLYGFSNTVVELSTHNPYWVFQSCCWHQERENAIITRMSLGFEILVKSNLANIAKQRATPILATGYHLSSLPTTQSYNQYKTVTMINNRPFHLMISHFKFKFRLI
jgi:hypothetical protein